PLLACRGLRVPMISGRGLGPTGGTLDKLEAIPGFQTQLSSDTIQRIANECGCVIAGASEQIAPADKRLYGLRDVTGTVPCIPLITASIMSKKLAEGLDALVLDVKWGSGAFMKSLERARALARSLADTGRAMGVTTTALITDMNQPLGRSIGNANEVDESVDCLRGAGPADLRDLTIELGVELLISAGLAQPHQRTDARQQLNRALDSGQAYEKFAEFVRAQGGDPEAPRQLAPAVDVPSVRDGFVTAVDAERLGYTIIDLGGGRRQKTDAVDHAVGIEMLVRIGDPITRGQPLAQLRARTADDRERGAKAIREAIRIGESPVTMPELIVERCSEQGP
ncbi:MAG: thymidine phosphorylase, partial [Planctomycetales bacterium]|nr:thymidine phosphorylase [Planctomycetales bacterium]